MGKVDFDVFVEGRPLAGKPLKGFVLIDVTKQISGSNLVVRLAGYEKTRLEMDWSKKKMIPKMLKPAAKGLKSLMEMCDDKNYQYERTKQASTRILSIEIPVGSAQMISEKKIEPGKYKLPFEIELPKSLPSSMEAREDRNLAEIVYTMEAQLKGSGWLKDYKTSKDIHIDAQALDEEAMFKIPYEAKPETMPVSIGYCKNAGDMTFGCLLDNTVTACGKSIQVTVAGRNESTLGVNEVKAKIVQIVTTEAAGHQLEKQKTLVKRSFGNWDALSPITDEEKGSRGAGSKVRDTTTQKNKMYEELKAGTHQVTIDIPRHAIPTYEGELIQVKHVLRVRIVSSFMIKQLAPCPEIEIPIQIYDAPDKDETVPSIEIPPWAADVANFIMGSVVTAGAQDVNWNTADAGTGGEEEIIVEPEENSVDKTPSIPRFLQQMGKTNNHIALVQTRMQDPSWQPVLKSIDATIFGSILKKVEFDFQKPPVAVLLATHITNFSCNHIVEAIVSCPEWMRTTMVETLVEFCNDFPDNKGVIESKLTDWEKTVLQDKLSGNGAKKFSK